MLALGVRGVIRFTKSNTYPLTLLIVVDASNARTISAGVAAAINLKRGEMSKDAIDRSPQAVHAPEDAEWKIVVNRSHVGNRSVFDMCNFG